MAAALKQEIAQQRPFASVEEEALLNVLRTSDCLQRAFVRRTRHWGITPTQYNVLRILRGAGEAGLPTLAIRDRMVAASPGVTRLVDRLERAGYAQRERSAPDRRQVVCRITAAGVSLLSRLDGPVSAYDDEAVEMLTAVEKRELVRLLDAVRAGNRERA